jgi:hypothetical protein
VLWEGRRIKKFVGLDTNQYRILFMLQVINGPQCHSVVQCRYFVILINNCLNRFLISELSFYIKYNHKKGLQYIKIFLLLSIHEVHLCTFNALECYK